MSTADAQMAVILAARCLADLGAFTPKYSTELSEDLAILNTPGDDPRDSDANMVSKWTAMYAGARASGARPVQPFSKWEAVSHAIAVSKMEILEEMFTGRIPPDVTDFADLHSYVDANEFGGLCDESPLWDWDPSGDNNDAGGAVQDAVHAWLQAGRPTGPTTGSGAPEVTSITDEAEQDTFTVTMPALGEQWVRLEIRDADGDFRSMLVTVAQWQEFLTGMTA